MRPPCGVSETTQDSLVGLQDRPSVLQSDLVLIRGLGQGKETSETVTNEQDTEAGRCDVGAALEVTVGCM